MEGIPIKMDEIQVPNYLYISTKFRNAVSDIPSSYYVCIRPTLLYVVLNLHVKIL
jgi:hypothetical protein